MLDSYVAQKNFEKAQQLLAAEQARTTNTKDLVSLRVDQAFLASKRGDNKTAVEQLEKLAAEYPKERQAATGLVTAAQLLMDGKQPDRARELLQKFLAMESGDLEYEQRARDMLAQLKAAQPAGDAVKSAMEYAPAGK
jgi:tetratricopeptide (TPR) repeat protein